MTPATTIGFIGGGQLARMMAASAIGLGLRVRLLAEESDTSAAGVVPGTMVGDYTDEKTVAAFADPCEVITFDHEHVPQPILRRLLADGVAVRPGPDALIHAQDKAVMRERLAALGVPCPAFEVVHTPSELAAAGDRLGWPLVAKVSRGGYDGHGVWVCDGPAQAGEPFASRPSPGLGEADGLGDDGAAESYGAAGGVGTVVAEERVDFVRELSALVVRGVDGTLARYPVSESVQADGMCRATITPAPIEPALAAACLELAERIAAELGVVGVLAVELMQRRTGGVVVNELAMRPHNTGHWTIGGARTSQFENHLRAVAGLPLGDAGMAVPCAVMANVLGDAERLDVPAWLARALAVPGVSVQWYGKGWRPGRKLGHVTAVGEDRAAVVAAALAALPPGATRSLLESVIGGR